MSGEKLRRLLARDNGVFAYGVYDAMSAMIAELAGHECIYVGGYSDAASVGLPDIGLRTMSEVRDHAKFISEAVSTPLFVDIDDGYGSVNNVRRTVREFLVLPQVAALHIEDQPFPKRCGHIAGKGLVPLNEFVGKLKVAIDTKNSIDSSRVIVARTDSFGAAGGKFDEHLGGDIQEAVKRGIAYADAGADLLWCEFPTPDPRTAEAFAGGVRRAHPQMNFAFNISPSFSAKDWLTIGAQLDEGLLNSLGYKLRFSTYPGLLESASRVFDSAVMFKREATDGVRALKERLVGHPAESIKKLIRLENYLALERKYDPRGKEKQNSSQGFGSKQN